MSEYSAAFLHEVADHIRSCHYGSDENNAHAAVEAARFDAMAVEREDAERLAVDIGRVAIAASEGVAYGSEPDDFFRAAGEAALCWLPLNGFHVVSAEQLEDVRTVSNCALQYGNIASREASSRLTSSLLEAESAKPKPWQRIEDVPVGVTRVEDSEGDIWVIDNGKWYPHCVNGSKPNDFAPFVAAEEG